MLRQYKLKDYKFRLVLWVLILSVIGIMVIGSANSNYQMKQMIGMGVGIVFMIMVSLMDYLWISNFYWIYYIGGASDRSTFLRNRGKRCKALD